MTDQGNIATELDAAGVADAMRRLGSCAGRPGSIFTSDLSVTSSCWSARPGSGRSAWSWAAPSTTSGCRSAGGAPTRILTCCLGHLHAHELAMTRMEAEADALRADGIVGVRLDVE